MRVLTVACAGRCMASAGSFMGSGVVDYGSLLDVVIKLTVSCEWFLGFRSLDLIVSLQVNLGSS